MASDKDTMGEDKFNTSNRLIRRLAVIDRFGLTSVTNKAFNEYFQKAVYGSLTDFVYPDEKRILIEFIDAFKGEPISRVFRFKNAKGVYRQNLLRLLSFDADPELRNINIEMVDIDSAMEVNDQLRDDALRAHISLGLTGEYTFSYENGTNFIKILKYDLYSREIIYRMDIDEWKDEMLDSGIVAEEDRDILLNLVTQIKAYTPSFSACISTSMRTRGNIMETVKFIGTLYNKYNGERIIVGRIVSDGLAAGNSNVAEILDEITYDSLTHVYNKKTITDYATKLVQEEKENRVTVAVLDVDHFKKVNDIYGHLYGDKVLTRVARKIKESVGDDGVVGRIGGDEFVIVFNGINDDNSLRGMLRAIRTQIKWEFVNEFENFELSASIGAAFSPNNGTDYLELFKKADYCLYIAKEKGRDRYVFFRDELHLQSYEDSFKNKEQNASDGREMKELRYLTGIMLEYNNNREKAVRNMLDHILENYRVDSINIYYGPELKKVKFLGQELNNSEDASYVFTKGFQDMIEDRMYAETAFVGCQMESAPEFCEAMQGRRVFSTIQCIIGSRDNIKGLITMDRTKESSQWAQYEVEIAVITASLIYTIIVDKQLD